MSEYKHICGSCKKKECPDAGNEKYDGMMGPCILCQEYKSPFWSLDWFVRWSMLLVLTIFVLCLIHAIVT